MQVWAIPSAWPCLQAGDLCYWGRRLNIYLNTIFCPRISISLQYKTPAQLVVVHLGLSPAAVCAMINMRRKIVTERDIVI